MRGSYLINTARSIAPLFKTPKLGIIGLGEIGKKLTWKFCEKWPDGVPVNVLLYVRPGSEYKVPGFIKDLSSSLPTTKRIDFIYGSNPVFLKDCKAIAFCAGKSASKDSSIKSREDLLPYNYALVANHAKDIKKYVDPKTLILMLPNPTGQTAWAMAAITGFPNVIGCGTELDAIRFRSALRNSLEQSHFIPTPEIVEADVIGDHTPKNMIVPIGSIKLDGHHIDTTNYHLMTLVGRAEEQMQKEGFQIVASGETASIGPSTVLARTLIPYLLGSPDPTRITGSKLLIKGDKYEGIEPAIIGDVSLAVPLLISSDGVHIDPQPGYTLTNDERRRLHNTAIENAKLMDEVIARFNKNNEELERTQKQLETIKENLKKHEARVLSKFKDWMLNAEVFQDAVSGLVKDKPMNYFEISQSSNLDTSISITVKNERRSSYEIEGVYFGILENILVDQGIDKESIKITRSLEPKSHLSIPNTTANKKIIKDILQKNEQVEKQL